MSDACEMVARCFRYQHPEQFGGQEIEPEHSTWTSEPVPYNPVIPQEHDGRLDGHIPIGCGPAEVTT